MLSSLLDLSNVARAAAAVGFRESLSEAVSEIERRMQVASNLDAEMMHGRKAIDASFNLALAGVSTPWMFDQLAEQAEREVRKWGRRKSCSSMTLCQLGERLAAAGYLAGANQPLYQLLGDILAERGEFETTSRALLAGTFGLEHSLPAARWVNRASAKQSKLASTSATDFSSAADWGAAVGGEAALACLFADPTRPLTLDIGCGYGCGPLIYARSARGEGENVLGCDLSAGGISFARGLATRWDVDHRCAFVRDDARAVLRRVREAYPGCVHRIILSCPTPYASVHDADDDEEATHGSGNSQLPASPRAASFLGNEEVIEDMAACLAPGGALYLASNVEDVAVTMMSSAQSRGLVAQRHATDAEARLHLAWGAKGVELEIPPEQTAQTTGGASSLLVPRRQSRWREAGGTPAIGAPWESARPMLWASETERTHILEERPVHRVVLRKG